MNTDDPTQSAPAPENAPPESTSRLKQAAEEIVKRGQNVRAEIARLVSEAATTLQEGKNGLVSLAKAVADGAAAGAKQTMPENTDNLLRPVVSGISDGIAKVAEAMKLAMQESASRGKTYAKEDLDKVAREFRSVGDGFVSTVQQSASSATGHVSEQVKALANHAKLALNDMKPALDAVISSATQDPLRLGKETLHAGTAAAREAAGVLATEIGALLQSAGQKLRNQSGQ